MVCSVRLTLSSSTLRFVLNRWLGAWIVTTVPIHFSIAVLRYRCSSINEGKTNQNQRKLCEGLSGFFGVSFDHVGEPTRPNININTINKTHIFAGIIPITRLIQRERTMEYSQFWELVLYPPFLLYPLLYSLFVLYWLGEPRECQPHT